MPEMKTSRPFQERFLDGYDRAQLRRDVQKVKPQKRLESLKRKYATWALGASLALGGLGVPLKIHDSIEKSAAANTAPPPSTGEQPNATGEIARDLTAAKAIADQVAGGVTDAAAKTVGRVVSAPAEAVSALAQAPKMAAQATDAVKQQFFKDEVPFGSIIYSEAKKNDLPPELVAAVVHTESKFVPNARSQAGAMGLMQLVPKTGRWMGARNLMNPAENISAGAKYLRYLTDRFGGDQQKAVAAYNAGEGNVRRFNGVPPFRETRNYISRVKTFQNELGDRFEGHVAQVAEAR
jgi:soluble lytic murein transglycosylase-like protein